MKLSILLSMIFFFYVTSAFAAPQGYPQYYCYSTKGTAQQSKGYSVSLDDSSNVMHVTVFGRGFSTSARFIGVYNLDSDKSYVSLDLYAKEDTGLQKIIGKFSINQLGSFDDGAIVFHDGAYSTLFRNDKFRLCRKNF